MADGISPKIPIEVGALKDILRRGLSNTASRVYWWPYLPNLPANPTIDSYPDLAESSGRLSGILGDIAPIPQDMPKNKEKELILNSTNSLLQVLLRSKIISNDEIPNFDVLLRIIVHQLKQPELCCMLAGDLLSNREKYADPDPAAHAIMLDEFREVLSAFAPKTYMSLFSTGALEDRFLDMMFQDFFIELLPPEVVLRVIDAFLLEGSKILFRYGLAIIRAYKTQIKANTYNTATNFWLAVKADAANAATKANTAMLFKTLGREERLPNADPFVIFSKAKNPDFLETNLIYEYPFDEDRSMFSKLRRPMQLTKRGSFTSPLASINTNSAGSSSASNTPVASGSMKASLSRKSSFTNAGPRASVADMILNQSQDSNSPHANSGAGSAAAVTPTGASNNVPVLARRGSLNTSSFKLDKRRASNESSPLPPAPSANAYTSPVPTEGSDAAQYSAGSVLSPPPAGMMNKKAEELQALELKAVGSAMASCSSILSSGAAQRLLEVVAQAVPLAYQLVFTSTAGESNQSLSTLYAALGSQAPGMLVVQLAAPHEHVVLGAYFASPLIPGVNGEFHARTFVLNKLNPALATSSDVVSIAPTQESLLFGERDAPALSLNEVLSVAFTGADAAVAASLTVEESGYAVKEVEVYVADFGEGQKGNTCYSDINDM